MSKVQENFDDEEQEDLDEIEEEQEDTRPKKETFSGQDPDENVTKASKSIFNKLYDIEEEEADEDDEIKSIPMEDGAGDIPFQTEGEEKGIIISPYSNIKKYSLIFVNEQGAIIKTIPDIRGLYKAKVKFQPGKYQVIVKSRDNNLPFSAKIM